MRKIFFIAAFTAGSVLNAHSQGCVAIRSTGGMCVMDHAEMASESGSGTASKWLLNANSRYFNSYKHFVGRDEQKHRVDAGTQVINHNYTLDLALTRIIDNRWSLSVDVPIISNTRSSLYEHGGKERHTTSSFGLGDIRVWANYWLLDPVKHRKFNVQAGLGLKLATGNYRYTGRFYTAAGTFVSGPVDQSIQLGDGGTGITTEINAYYNIARHLGVYGNFYYLANPQELNGVSSARGGTPSATAVANGSDIMSVPDQYMLRGGVNYNAKNWMFSAGIRKECVPVHDLIGGSLGFRRPGYVVSIEPGVTYSFRKFSLYAYAPVAIERNRTQSMADRITTDLTGKYTQGDAAFADYAVNIGITLKL